MIEHQGFPFTVKKMSLTRVVELIDMYLNCLNAFF